MRFSILCTPTDSSDKTQLMYSTILLCLFTSKYDINGDRLNYITLSSNKFKYINMYIICQDKAWLVLLSKKLLKSDWEYVYIKRHFFTDPMSILVSHQAVPPTFYNKIAPMRSITTHEIIWETNSKKGDNVFCAPTETLVQRTNDANKMGQAFSWTVSCV